MLVDQQNGTHVHPVYPFTREPMIKYQPSTSTNSSTLKGREIVTGGSIIMPMLSRMLATTMSTTRKGRKIMKPISKAVFSSLMRKAGSRHSRGTSAFVLGAGALAILRNSDRSFFRV